LKEKNPMLVMITGTCGHEYERDVTTASGSEPKNKASLTRATNYWTTKMCKDCFVASKKAEVSEFDTPDLPELEGSEKQVNWAKTLRLEALKKIDEELSEVGVEFLEDSYPGYRELMVKKLTLLKRVVEAKFWIEVRDYSGGHILDRVDLDLESVTTVWYAKPKEIVTRFGYRRSVGGTKPRYTEYKLSEVK
jgi:hypothetical protein